MIAWLFRGILERRREAAARKAAIVREMGGMPPSLRMPVDGAPAKDERSVTAIHEGILGRRFLSR